MLKTIKIGQCWAELF